MVKLSKNIGFKLSLVVSVVIFSLFGGSIGTAKAVEFDSENEIITEETAALAEVLRVVFEDGLATDKNGFVLGYDREIFEEELRGHEAYEEIIQQIDEAGMFVDKTEDEIESNKVSPMVVACEWHGMKDKPEYTNAANKCILGELESNYGPVTVVSTIANLIGDKEFTLAAKKILALGVRSNIYGVVVTLGYIQIKCINEMEDRFPGKSNCK